MDVMSQVRIGMRVLDNSGEEVGTVADLKSGDSGAVTGEGQQTPQSGGLLADLARSLGGGPDLHRQTAERLLRVGYIVVDQAGVFSGQAFASADKIQNVNNDTVRLSVTSAEMPEG